jgi:hypothetical protein
VYVCVYIWCEAASTHVSSRHIPIMSLVETFSNASIAYIEGVLGSVWRHDSYIDDMAHM